MAECEKCVHKDRACRVIGEKISACEEFKTSETFESKGHIDEPRLTDEQIKKALECCRKKERNTCPCYDDEIECGEMLIGLTLNLINRKNAEIEKLERANIQLMAILQTAQSEARKEFVERFKTKLSNFEYRDENPNMKQKGEWILHEVIPIEVDNLLKEMDGDKS